MGECYHCDGKGKLFGRNCAYCHGTGKYDCPCKDKK